MSLVKLGSWARSSVVEYFVCNEEVESSNLSGSMNHWQVKQSALVDIFNWLDDTKCYMRKKICTENVVRHVNADTHLQWFKRTTGMRTEWLS